MPKTPKLALSQEERAAIRKASFKLAGLAEMSPPELAMMTGLALQRCEYLVALSQFQRLGSVGPASAQDLWNLGYRSVAELKGENPRAMYERLSGGSLDPCVEDVLRCAVAQASYASLPAPLHQWWAWSDQRGESSVRLPDGDD